MLRLKYLFCFRTQSKYFHNPKLPSFKSKNLCRNCIQDSLRFPPLMPASSQPTNLFIPNPTFWAWNAHNTQGWHSPVLSDTENKPREDKTYSEHRRSGEGNVCTRVKLFGFGLTTSPLLHTLSLLWKDCKNLLIYRNSHSQLHYQSFMTPYYLTYVFNKHQNSWQARYNMTQSNHYLEVLLLLGLPRFYSNNISETAEMRFWNTNFWQPEEERNLKKTSVNNLHLHHFSSSGE